MGLALKLGKGEEKSGGRDKESILAASFEALIGAIYLDRGFMAARRVLARQFASDLQARAAGAVEDCKTRLQEITQRMFKATPTYTLVRETGPDHAKNFVSQISIGGRTLGRGEGQEQEERRAGSGDGGAAGAASADGGSGVGARAGRWATGGARRAQGVQLRNGRSTMIAVPAMRVRQFGVDFYQAVLTGPDVEKLVRFEVLSYDAGVVPMSGGKRRRSGRRRSTGSCSRSASRAAPRPTSAR